MHGGFSSFIPVGIRIGIDALQRLSAKPREVTVVYYDSDKALCACTADGIAIATQATVGQRTLKISSESAPEGVAYQIAGSRCRPNGTERWMVYDQVMKASELFDVSEMK